MLRWWVVVVLVIASVVSAWGAFTSTEPRGLILTRYDNLRWEGEPVEESRVRHVDFGPTLKRNPRVLPDRSSLRMDGHFYAPRRGAYEFVIESTDDAWLRLDERTVVTHRAGQGMAEGRVMLSKGFHPIRIQLRHRSGESDLRISMRLPAGYMDLEALNPVFLHPEEPREGPTLPLPLRAGPLLLLLLAGLVAMGPWLSRALGRLQRDPELRQRFAAGLCLFLVAFSFRAWDINGTGETSDEWAYCGAGRIYVSNMAHGYFESAYWHTNEEHPPLGKYVYGLVSHLTGTDSYTPLRLTSALLGALTVLLTYLFALRFMSLGVGLLAGLILCFLPPFVAHGKVAALDSPSAFMFTLGVVLFVRALLSVERRNIRFLVAALVACLAFTVKFSNVLLFVYMALLHFVSQWRRIRERGTIEIPIPLYVLPVLPFIVLFVLWPWLWREPFGQLVTTLKHWDYPIQEWFLGEKRQPPWYYFPLTFLATTPALLLVPVGAYILRFFRRRSLVEIAVLLWFLTPFIWTLSVLKQDGIRYIYSMYPPLALMAAAGLWPWVARAGQRAAVMAGTVLYLVWQCLTVHPYYVDYYSEVVGGPQTVYEHSLFEIGWWGEGQDKAYAYINAHAPQGATWNLVGVVHHTTDALREDLRFRAHLPDYVIAAYLSPAEQHRTGYTAVFSIEVASAPIVVVYQRDDLLGEETPHE